MCILALPKPRHFPFYSFFEENFFRSCLRRPACRDDPSASSSLTPLSEDACSSGIKRTANSCYI